MDTNHIDSRNLSDRIRLMTIARSAMNERELLCDFSEGAMAEVKAIVERPKLTKVFLKASCAVFTRMHRDDNGLRKIRFNRKEQWIPTS